LPPIEQTARIPALPLAATTRMAVDRDDVSLAARGDGSAFERLYRAHAARVHGLVRRMSGGRDADELTQDVFVRVWQKLDTFRGDAAFATWLHRLAVNVVIERFRSSAVRRARLHDGDAAVALLAAHAAGPELSIDFEAAILRLPEGARQIFVLHDVEGYKHAEIAALLGIAPGTSKAQLHRARMMLRKHLGKS
jgi:RNA polymerase sigma-70 factor (ECF subfamily)